MSIPSETSILSYCIIFMTHTNTHLKKFVDKKVFFSEKLHINSENFSMIHLNIRSAKKKIERFKDFLSQTGSFFKVICLTETWFDDRNSES